MAAVSSSVVGMVQEQQATTSEACVPIDFESVPGAAPKEGLLITNHYSASHGVSFSLENGTSPRIAAVGRPQTAFAGPPNDNGPDTPAKGQDVGQFFLTDDGAMRGLTPPPLIVTYDPPAASASGVVLDIDYDETLTIEARDASGKVTSSVVIRAGEPNTGDGVASRWSVSHETADIASIRFSGRRTASGSFGLGFDGFCARARSAGAILQLSFDASVLFDFNKSALRPEAQAALAEASAQLSKRKSGRVLVEGHTDNMGTDAYNEGLSLDRAQAVSKVLSSSPGLKAFQIESVGYGSRRPIAGNDTDSGRQRNRRVEIVLVSP